MSTDLSHLKDEENTRPMFTEQMKSAQAAGMPDDSEQFIRQAFKQDPQKGCELLFREYYRPLCSHAVRFVYSREVACDLVSDLFCVFFQNRIYDTIDTSYRAYLYTAVRNRSLKYLQREYSKINSMPTEESGQEIMTNTPSPEDLLRYDDLFQRIETVVRELSPQSQKVFLMNRYDGKKYKEISLELQISIKTVEAHMSKALDRLRKALQADWLE
jgi:RNA polymerase sigma-70 factor (family 1)